MENPTTQENNIIGEKGGPLRERQAFQAERDLTIQGWVNTYQVVDAALLSDLIGYPQTPQHVQLAERHIERLHKEKLFQLCEQTKLTYAVSYAYSLRRQGATGQLMHRAMESRRVATFDRCLTFDETLSAEDLRFRFRKVRGALIPDTFARLGDRGFSFEDETGQHSVQQLVRKSALYAERHKDLASYFGVKRFRVIWNLRQWTQVPLLLKALRDAPSPGLFLVCHSVSTFNPSRAAQTLGMELFLSPKDNDPHRLLED